MRNAVRTLDLSGHTPPFGESLDGVTTYGVSQTGLIPPAGEFPPGVYDADIIMGALPFPDNFFGIVYAHGVLERIPKLIITPGFLRFTHRYCLVELFNEIWRVLKPGCMFQASVPIVPTNWEGALGDPTHLSAWCENSFNYWCAAEGNFELALLQRYGYRARFQRLAQRRIEGHLFIEMRAVKTGIDHVQKAISQVGGPSS